MKLQLALDDLSMNEAISLLNKVKDYIDIIEIGTPMVYKEGLAAVSSIKKHFPYKEILADLKIMDAGQYETEAALLSGADYVTVLAVSDDVTIRECVCAANASGKKIVADLICVNNIPRRLKELSALGVHAVAVHAGTDQQALGRSASQELALVTDLQPNMEIFVAGGINKTNICNYSCLNPSVIIVGSGLSHSDTPEADAQEIKKSMHSQIYDTKSCSETSSETALETIVEELKQYYHTVKQSELYHAERMILQAGSVFVAGVGRSGFAARAFANRLMHLGLSVHYIGEPTTPAICENDLCIIASGSGETSSLVSIAKKVKEQNTHLLTFSLFRDSSIGRLADAHVILPGSTPKSLSKTSVHSSQPMGNLFEQMSWLVYDAIIIDLKNMLNKTSEELFHLHANLE